jgi:hypothetical protein
MNVTCESGCAFTIPECDTVFLLCDDLPAGSTIDPERVDFDAMFAADALQPGSKIIVNNRVEVVQYVW